jgi:acetolactate synthase-1/2/3 large subunit
VRLNIVVAKFLEEHGVKHVFGVNGGACLWLIHGLTENTNVKFIPTAHEQGAGFAADAYARLGGVGVAMATSGPGATNLVTAIAASYQDSVPTLFLTGNVATFRQGARFGVRAYGFQELDVVSMVGKITKYAVQVSDPYTVLYHLGKALWVASQGRKGPVLVDLPDDLQRLDIDPDRMEPWVAPCARAVPHRPMPIKEVAQALLEARRPLFVWGAGVRDAAEPARALAASLGVPVACSWGAIDLMPAADELMCGGFGTHGTRPANFAVQNADLIISLGCRLDTKATGTPSHFARGARIAMVDMDAAELGKFRELGRRIDFPVQADCLEFVKALAQESAPQADWQDWRRQIAEWKRRYPSTDHPDWTGVRPYAFMRELAEYTTADDVIVSDTGCTLGWAMQGFPFKGERFVHAFNMTPMGYALPAAVGAAFATGKRVICLCGDGSIMMSLSELATIRRWNLPVKIFVFNNKGHAMCRQTQRQWLGSKYPATSLDGGLGFPDFENVADAFGIWVGTWVFMWPFIPGPLWGDVPALMPKFTVLKIDPEAQLIPQARYGAPIEDGDPALSREELRSQMIVPLLENA